MYECFDGYLPVEGIEYVYYGQLGSYHSDQPDDPALWTIEHFVAEDYENPRYEELLMQHHYTEHVLRMPLEQWPNSIMRTFKHLNMDPGALEPFRRSGED